jgi:L-rhamnose mutarotase
VKRYGSVIGLKVEKIDEYKRLHAEVWPAVLAKISECNIQNYSIYLREPENLLFSYFEYMGNDFDADMAKLTLKHNDGGVSVFRVKHHLISVLRVNIGQ